VRREEGGELEKEPGGNSTPEGNVKTYPLVEKGAIDAQIKQKRDGGAVWRRTEKPGQSDQKTKKANVLAPTTRERTDYESDPDRGSGEYKQQLKEHGQSSRPTMLKEENNKDARLGDDRPGCRAKTYSALECRGGRNNEMRGFQMVALFGGGNIPKAENGRTPVKYP